MDTSPPPVLRLTGALDLHAVRGLSQPFNDIIGSRSGSAIVDVSDVSFIDSMGLGAIVRTHQRLKRQQRELIVVCPPGPVADLLQLTNLLGVLNTVGSEDAAVQLAQRMDAPV